MGCLHVYSCLVCLTFEVTGRRSGEAAEGTEKRSFSAVRVDREVRRHGGEPIQPFLHDRSPRGIARRPGFLHRLPLHSHH